jgi:APA family basic amino acid/polyamine antiporter
MDARNSTVSSIAGPGAAALKQGTELRRVLTMRDLVLLIIGTVVGSGIFLVPGLVLRSVGNSVVAALLVWLTGGMLSLLGALTYGELSAMKPEAGGLYVYIRDCFGSLRAFLFGWTLFLVISSGSVATLAVAFSNYLGEFVALPSWAVKLVSVAMILTIAIVNVRGTRQSSDLLNAATFVKVSAILAMSGALLYLEKTPTSLAIPAISIAHVGASASGFGVAMISVLWAYEGWQYATFSAGETVNAQRNFPLAFLVGMVALIGIYVCANLGYIAALGPDGVANSTRVAASAVSIVMGAGIAKLVAITILISMFSAANSIILTGTRVFYAMAKDGLFFKPLAKLHPRFGTPLFAVIAATTWSAVLAVSGTFEQLLTYVVFIGWIFYALAAACVFIYRTRDPNAVRPYRVPGYPFTPIIFIVTAMVIVINMIMTQPGRAAVGLGIALLGVPVYVFWNNFGQRGKEASASESDG